MPRRLSIENENGDFTLCLPEFWTERARVQQFRTGKFWTRKSRSQWSVIGIWNISSVLLFRVLERQPKVRNTLSASPFMYQRSSHTWLQGQQWFQNVFNASMRPNRTSKLSAKCWNQLEREIRNASARFTYEKFGEQSSGADDTLLFIRRRKVLWDRKISEIQLVLRVLKNFLKYNHYLRGSINNL